MLSKSMISKLFSAIEKDSHFSAHDFIIDNGNKFIATYRYVDEYYYVVDVARTLQDITRMLGEPTETRRYIRMRPSFAYEEKIVPVNKDDIIEKVFQEWLQALWDDVISEPALRNYKNLEAKLEELRRSVKKEADEPFAENEILEWGRKLEELKAGLIKKLEESIEDQEELKQQVKQLAKEVAALKQGLPHFTKKKWFSFAATRVGLWLSDPKNTIGLIEIGERVKGLLGS